MRKHIFTTITLLPLLLGVSYAAQRWTSDSAQPWGIPSEDSGGSSYLGVDIMDITADRLGALKLKEEQGVEVTMVDQDAPAGKAGLQEHDVILTMNGAPVESKTQLQRMIHETPPGRVVALGLSRDGQPMTIKVQLADRHNEFPGQKAFKNDFHFEVPPMNLPDFDVPNIGVVVVHSSMRSGLMVENLTPQLGDFFGAKNGHGVLVRSVEKGSRADKAGLRAGDVITRLGDQSVHDTSDFTHALHSHSTGQVSVGVIRDKKDQTLTLTLPDRKESGEVLEESFEAPVLDAETMVRLSEATSNEIARLGPQLELARDEAVRVATEVRQSVCEKSKHSKEQIEKMNREIQPGVKKELEKSRQKIQQEIQHHVQGDWLDI